MFSPTGEGGEDGHGEGEKGGNRKAGMRRGWRKKESASFSPKK